MSSKSKSAQQPPPDAKAVYDHARRFVKTDELLRALAKKNPQVRVWCQSPSMVISTFASELMLKCLLILENKNPSRDHNLLTLFNRLDSPHRKQIEDLWNAKQASAAVKKQLDEHEDQFGIKIPRDLQTALQDCQDAFKWLRYEYENPLKATYYITFLPKHVRDVIRSITGWPK
jgi:HEPN domain-containing protein